MSENLLFGNGVLVYDPRRDGRRDRPWRAILECDHGLVLYYHWWVKRRLDAYAILPSVRAHLTLVKREPPKPQGWGHRQGETFSFVYRPEIRTDNGFYWIDVQSPALSDIVERLGYPPKDRFHLTIAKRLEIA